MNNINKFSNFIKYDNHIINSINYFKENFKNRNDLTYINPIIFYSNVIYPNIMIYHEELYFKRGIIKKKFINSYSCNSINEYNQKINDIKQLNNYYIYTIHTDLSYNVCFYLAESDNDIYYIKINERNECTKAQMPKEAFYINNEIYSKNKRFFSQDNINNIIKTFEME